MAHMSVTFKHFLASSARSEAAGVALSDASVSLRRLLGQEGKEGHDDDGGDILLALFTQVAHDPRTHT